MITNFKIFKKIDYKYSCWYVSTKYPNFEASLFKIGLNINEINDFCEAFATGRNQVSHIYVALTIEPVDRRWVWSSKKYGHYMGKVKVTEKDIENWEIAQNSNKYNL